MDDLKGRTAVIIYKDKTAQPVTLDRLIHGWVIIQEGTLLKAWPDRDIAEIQIPERPLDQKAISEWKDKFFRG